MSGDKGDINVGAGSSCVPSKRRRGGIISDNDSSESMVHSPSFFYEKSRDGDESLLDISVSDENIDDPDYVVRDKEKIDSCISKSDSDCDLPGPNVDLPVEKSARPSVPVVRKHKVGRQLERNPEKWEKNVAKRKRNRGEEYTTYTKKLTVAARHTGTPCKDGCFHVIGLEKVKDVFKKFWAIGDYDMQNTYLMSLIREEQIKRKRTKEEVSKRQCNFGYFIKTENSEFKVCRSGFASIFGFSDQKIRVLVAKKRETATGMPVPDKRGKHPSSRAIKDIRLDRVKEHIESLVVTASHYSRARNPHRRYMEADGGSIPMLYGLYLSWMADEHPEEETVKRSFYHHIFTKKYNIVFKRPVTDKCNNCDILEKAIRNTKDSKGDTRELQDLLNTHKEAAEIPRNILANHETVKPNKNGNMRCIAMDLQQTLPLPRLNANAAFYKTKLWLFNFCIHDINNDKSWMFLWDETTASRGADEIGSCLIKWLNIQFNEKNADFVHLRIFCDNCAGQNKNKYLIMTALREVHSKRLFRVEFVFMKSGHSFLPCDRSFGKIEMQLRGMSYVGTPEEYQKIIQHSVHKTFPVIQMKREDFFDLKSLGNHIVKKQQKPGIASACQLVVCVNYKEGFYIKNDYIFEDDEDTLIKVKYMKGKGAWKKEKFDLSSVPLPIKYATARLVDPKKLQDLQKLKRHLLLNGLEWLNQLLASQEDLRKKGITSMEADEDLDDPESTAMDYLPVQSLP